MEMLDGSIWYNGVSTKDIEKATSKEGLQSLLDEIIRGTIISPVKNLFVGILKQKISSS